MRCEYLVTGGRGFIGNELVRQLRAADKSVAILDNGSRIAPLLADIQEVPLYDVDVVKHDKVAAIIKDLRPRVVFHLAAVHFIPDCNANPDYTLRVNVEGTLGLIRACSASSVEHVLFASSGAIYADCTVPLSEASPVEPVDIYGWSKLQAEQLCRWHATTEDIRVTVCRLFNNYGPRETNPHIIPEILNQVRNGNTLHLGNVTPRRDYVHTSDTARAFRLLAEQDCGPTRFRIVNIASGQSASVRELVHIISYSLGRDLVIVPDPNRFRKADKEVQTADVSLLKSLTDWSRQVEFQDGLRALLDFEGLLSIRDPHAPPPPSLDAMK
jgi:UDP-glucose 4-epimerase